MFHVVRELLPFVFALYLLETVAHLGPGHRLFLSRFLSDGTDRRYRAVTAGFRWLGLRPDAWAFSAHRLLCAEVPEGLFLPGKKHLHGASRFHPESFLFFTYEELTELEAEHKTVRLRPGHAVHLPSPTHAAELAERLRTLRELDAEARCGHLEAWRREADLAALRRRVDTVRELRRPLELLCRILSVLVFVGLPATLYLSDSVRLLAALLLTWAAGHVLVLVRAVGLVRAIRHRTGVRIRGVLPPLFLSPPAALRAPAALTRDTLSGFDELTMAAAFLPREELVALARHELHGADHALGHDSGPDWRSPYWRRLWQERRDRLVGLLEQVGASEEEALASPPRSDPGAKRYCPLCLGEYRTGVEDCEDCGVPLLPFGGRL